MGLRVVRIGLLWHSANSGNLGLGALTIANIALVREAARCVGLEAQFVVIGMHDKGEESYFRSQDTLEFPLDSRKLLSPNGLWDALGALDCVLDIGGGDSFAEIYGSKRFFFLWWSKVLALVRSRPLLLSPQTIGPFTRRPYRMLARIPMTRAAAVVARDEESFEAIQEVAPKARRILSVDVAFALPYEDRSMLRGGPRLRVGVNVSGLLHAAARDARNRFGMEANYADLMERCLTFLAARDDVQLHLISHVRSDAAGPDNDEPLARELSRTFPSAVLAPRFKDPVEAKSYISGLDFLIAGRMHACIAAFSTGVPVVPVAYSRKFRGLFQMLGYRWMVPVMGLDTDAAFAYLMDCLDRRNQLAQDVSVGLQRVDSLIEAYKTELRRFLAEVAG